MTTYRGYEITPCGTDRFIIRLDGEWVTTVQGSLACAKFCIDSDYEDMTPQPLKPNAEYKDYTITNDEGFIIVYAKDGSIAGQGYNNAVEAMEYIDRGFKEPVDAYEGLELTEDVPTSYKCNGRRYKVLKKESPLFGQVFKEVSIFSKQGVTVGVCFEHLKRGEWHDESFLFSELKLVKDKKKAYQDAYSDQYGANLYLTDEEKDLIQKHAN